jgi:formylglycine-generating enzyme required for sulfatase activity
MSFTKVPWTILTSLPLLIAARPGAAQTPVSCAIRHQAEGMTNRALLSWEATRGSFYQVWTAMDLHHTWGLMTWFWATNISPSPQTVSVSDTNLQTRRFYTVVEGPVPEWLTNSSALLLEAAKRFRLVYIPAGTFTMGSPTNEAARLGDEGPRTTVTISRGFWMGKHEVTQTDFLELMGFNPSYFNGDRSGPPYNGQNYGTNLSRPVECVSWNDATNFCGRLTKRERTAQRLPTGYRFRLPTEAEWEYACRAGTTTPFHYGDELRSGMVNFLGLGEYPPCGGEALYCYNPNGLDWERTMTVGSYAPNAWGLYDMHGSLYEWCQDWYGTYPGGSVIDPTGPGLGSDRVLRGGSYGDIGWGCRSAFRYSYPPDYHPPGYGDRFYGFRVVLAPAP